MRKYKCTAKVTEWKDDNIIGTWIEKNIVVDEDMYMAMDKFAEAVVYSYAENGKDVELDDMQAEDIGPADVMLSVKLTDYTLMEDTMTVEELCQYLDDNFDPDSKIYLVNYSGIVPVYGYIDYDSCFNNEEV